MNLKLDQLETLTMTDDTTTSRKRMAINRKRMAIERIVSAVTAMHGTGGYPDLMQRYSDDLQAALLELFDTATAPKRLTNEEIAREVVSSGRYQGPSWRFDMQHAILRALKMKDEQDGKS